MSATFATPEMALGYATARPPVHPPVMREIRRVLGSRQFSRSLDIGCGAGLSTIALKEMAAERMGIDPSPAMVAAARLIDPSAWFCEAAAEALPVASGAVDLVTAAGSLNYADVEKFFPEATRVLKPEGVLVVYDFSAGRSFGGGLPGLDDWFEAFLARYPYPRSEARELNPAILSDLARGFTPAGSDYFTTALRLTCDFYVNYMLTETNVAAAIRQGKSAERIRAWCTQTVSPLWREKEMEVLFRGYYACFTRNP